MPEFESKKRIAAFSLAAYGPCSQSTGDTPMSETFRYAWGVGSLGDFVAVVSDRGLVAFEFGERGSALPEALGARFPEARLEEDAESLADIIGALQALIEHPDREPDIALDARGTDEQKRVWEILREIPAGKTTHYGAIAARLGTRDARGVTDAIASNAIAILIPCHRVLKKDGSLSGYRWGARRKRTLLARERRAGNAGSA
jgi:AraC family transcriptional regulator of adaptative response/methylated-DNA-[protein]-cysteine methyltransferase